MSNKNRVYNVNENGLTNKDGKFNLYWKFLLTLTGGHCVLGVCSKGLLHFYSFIFKDKRLNPSNLKKEF